MCRVRWLIFTSSSASCRPSASAVRSAARSPSAFLTSVSFLLPPRWLRWYTARLLPAVRETWKGKAGRAAAGAGAGDGAGVGVGFGVGVGAGGSEGVDGADGAVASHLRAGRRAASAGADCGRSCRAGADRARKKSVAGRNIAVLGRWRSPVAGGVVRRRRQVRILLLFLCAMQTAFPIRRSSCENRRGAVE